MAGKRERQVKEWEVKDGILPAHRAPLGPVRYQCEECRWQKRRRERKKGGGGKMRSEASRRAEFAKPTLAAFWSYFPLAHSNHPFPFSNFTKLESDANAITGR